MASSLIRLVPDDATITGSKIILSTSYFSSFFATMSITSTEGNIPIFTAPNSISESTASSCASMCAIGIICISVTPWVFCAVEAVITVAA